MTNYEYIPQDFKLVSLKEAAKHLRLYEGETSDGTLILSVPEDWELLMQYIEAAQGAAAAYIDRAIVQEELVIKLGAYQKRVCFDDWRVASVTSVMALIDGEEVSIPESNYYVFGTGAGREVVFRDPFVSDDITVRISCTVPKVIKQAVLLLLSDFYERREDREQGNSPASNNLLRPFRKY